MNVLQKIIRGDELRPTRLHTEAGEFVGLGSLLGFLPSWLTWLRYRASGKRICQPWWVWGAISFVGRHLRPEDRVLELGSGYSTLWLAQRCAQVVSIEESPYWKKKMDAEASNKGVDNLIIETGEPNSLFARLLKEEQWNIVIIDHNSDRTGVFDHLIASNMRPRIVVYDNTDRASDLATTKSIEGYECRIFRGFGPQTIHAWSTTVFTQIA